LNEELSDKIRHWNELLANIPPYDAPSEELKSDIEDNLHDSWQYPEEHFAFSGWCRVYEAGREPSAVDYVELADGLSYGFVVDRFGSEKGGRWGIGIDFGQFSDPITYERNLVVDTQAPHGIMLISELEGSFPEGMEFPTVWSILSQKSAELVKGTNDPRFFQLSYHEQRHYFDAVCGQAHRECLQFDDRLMNSPVAVGADIAYVQSSVDGRTRYAQMKTTDINLIGLTAGLNVLGRQQLQFAEPITTPAELIDPAAGICLQISVDLRTAQLINKDAKPPRELVEGSVIAVPISSQNVDAVFDEDMIKVLAEFGSA
jgi:hypothetical protein